MTNLEDLEIEKVYIYEHLKRFITIKNPFFIDDDTYDVTQQLMDCVYWDEDEFANKIYDIKMYYKITLCLKEFIKRLEMPKDSAVFTHGDLAIAEVAIKAVNLYTHYVLTTIGELIDKVFEDDLIGSEEKEELINLLQYHCHKVVTIDGYAVKLMKIYGDLFDVPKFVTGSDTQ